AVTTVAPSTAVNPATAFTARCSDSRQSRLREASGVSRLSCASSANAGTTAYGIGCTIDSCHVVLASGTTSSDPPRPCLRIDTASCTSTFTESTHEAAAANPRSDVSGGGQ